MSYRFSTSDFPSYIGLDSMFEMLDRMVDMKSPSYPPYSIKKVADNQYILEMAVAGFKKSEIDIGVADNKLTVSGKKESDNTSVYVHRGIATRSFNNTFPLAENVIVKGATMEDGILQVGLERIVPEALKPRKVEIGESLNFIPAPQLLTEEAA